MLTLRPFVDLPAIASSGEAGGLAQARQAGTLGILGTLAHFRHFLLIYPMVPNSLGIKRKFLYYELSAPSVRI